jgi:hypothetical protein
VAGLRLGNVTDDDLPNASGRYETGSQVSSQLGDGPLATVRELATNVEPYIRADGTKVWSLMQLERQLRPQAYRRRRGGYLDRR